MPSAGKRHIRAMLNDRVHTLGELRTDPYLSGCRLIARWLFVAMPAWRGCQTSPVRALWFVTVLLILNCVARDISKI